MRQIILSIIAVAILSSCTSNTTTKTNPIQKQWDAMMVIHDEVMPKLTEMNRLQKQLEGEEGTEQLILDLKTAENGMWDWMHNIKPLDQVKEMVEEAALSHLKEETAEIAKVSEDMLASIEAAKQFLTKNQSNE